METSSEELEKAIASLKEAVSLMKRSNLQEPEVQKALRDACIQRFEYSIELSWKTSMKILGSTTAAAKPAVREMARSNLILNAELWLEFIDSRNETSHAYDEDIAEKVFKSAQKFLPEAEALAQKLKLTK